MDDGERPDPRGLRITIVSGTHDYRAARRAGVHGLAQAFAGLGATVRFISIRFSALSFVTKDPRSPLWRRAGRFERHDNVESFLWLTPFHPLGAGGVGRALHRLYARLPAPALDDAFADSDIVIIESGLALVLVERIRRVNPHARLIYRCSDSLEAIGANPVLKDILEESAEAFAHVTVPARALAEQFPWAKGRVYFTPQGVDHAPFARAHPRPYDTPRNAVSVGSMLFDAAFFAIAGEAFPDVTFHVIGGPTQAFAAPPNVRRWGEMRFAETIPYLQHADVGLAPYRAGASYLRESSLKLTQFAHIGLPAVCPNFAAGRHPLRYGYEPGDADSIKRALAQALSLTTRPEPMPAPTWESTALRTLFPTAFADTRIDAAGVAA